MMPSINAATTPVDNKFNPVPASAQRSSNRDQSNDSNSFHNILRKSREDNQDNAPRDEPVKKASASKVDDSKNSDEKDAHGVKKAKADKKDTATVDPAQPTVVAPPKPALQALLNLLSVQQVVQNTSPENANPLPAKEDAPELLATDGAPSPATLQKPDVNILTAKDKRGGTPGSALPLSFDPILLAGANWGKETAAATAAGSNAGISAGSNGSTIASTMANAAQASTNDALAVAAQQNPETMAPSLSPKTLAFAMRLGSVTQPQETAKAGDAAPPPSVKALLDSTSFSAIAKSANDSEKQNAGDSSTDSGNMFGAAFADTGTGARTSADKVSFTDATNQVARTPGDEGINATNNSDPLRNILLQLKSDDNRRVDVRMVDRDGELHVSVRSADPALAQQVQEHMPELTSRLSDQQFTHDVWMPKLTEVAKSEAANNNGSDFNNNSQQSGQPNGGNAGRQQNSNGQSRPDWVDLLENQLG